MTANKTSSFIKLIFISSLLGIIPFLFFGLFTIPSSDDIFYHNYGKDKTTVEFLVHHYNTWTGRYFSNLMMAVNPYSLTSSEATYPLMTYFVQGLFAFSIFFFLKSLLHNFKNSLNSYNQNQVFAGISLNKICGFVLLIWLALFFHKMPRPTDSLYWFAGSSAHLIAESFLLLAVAIYLRSFSMSPLSKINSYLSIAVLSIAICGSNETLMLQWIFIMAFGFVFEKIVLNRFNFKILIPFFVSLFCFVIVFLAPGNKIRAANLHGGHDILLLMTKPLGLVFETSARYLSLNLIILIFWSLPLLKKINSFLPDFLKNKKTQSLFILFWIGLFLITFVPSVWTMGGLPPRRVLNNTYFMILFLSFFILLLKADSWSFLTRWKSNWDKYFPAKLQKVIFTISFIALFNSYFAWKDLLFTPKYLISLNERMSIVKDPKNQDTDVVVPPLSYFPSTYFYEDITADPSDYKNIVYAEFYKLKSIKLSKPYEASEVIW